MKKLLLVGFGCALTASALAETAGFQASLTPDIAVEDRDTRINGIRLNIWGENPQSGFALGFVNSASEDSKGLVLGIVNYAQTLRNGLQIGLVNIMPENEWFEDFPSDLAKGMVIVNWSFGTT
ncbi:MAG: hypothetical protein KAH99_04355 [Verrucomicrobia bacterium]|nr:hypothetical protein [Verrucomicrobiota bacterium]